MPRIMYLRYWTNNLDVHTLPPRVNVRHRKRVEVDLTKGRLSRFFLRCFPAIPLVRYAYRLYNDSLPMVLSEFYS